MDPAQLNADEERIGAGGKDQFPNAAESTFDRDYDGRVRFFCSSHENEKQGGTNR